MLQAPRLLTVLHLSILNDEWSLQKTHAHLCGYVSKISYGPKIGMLDQSIPIVLRKTEDIKGKRRILCSG